MAVSDPIKVPQKNITSLDVTGFSGGLNLLGEFNGQGNELVASDNIQLTTDGFITHRHSLLPWLPDVEGTVYQVKTVYYENKLTHFVADNGRIRWMDAGGTAWNDCGGDNIVTTSAGKTTFLRTLDVLLILNGQDRLGYVDLKTKNVVKFFYIPNPTTAPTAANTGLSGTTYKIYYGYTFSSATGETKISPILTHTIGKPRDTFKSDGTEYVTITRAGSIPPGATAWNLYIALASTGGTIQESDMLMLAGGLDLSNTSVADNGSLAIDIGRGTPPTDNSTEGPRATYGIENNGRPILFGDGYNIWIGGDGDKALDFSVSNGGFRAEVSKGTDYYPASVIGFRNGQGIPSLTILFSNTEGLSKQATMEQQTINYGDQTFVVWAVTEQNYGAAGVASSYGVVNYNGALSFPTTDGMMSMDTQPQLQNVLAQKRIADKMVPYFKGVNTSALQEIVGTGWDNKLYYIVPAYGFSTPNQIAVRDLDNNGAWTTESIKAQWIGTVSPQDSPAFVYVCQGNKILKLTDAFGTVDYRGGGGETFSTSAKGMYLGVADARNSYKAVVQAVFYVLGLTGEMTVGVNYRNENGKIKTKKKRYVGSKYVPSSAGGWSDPHYVYNTLPTPARWSDVTPIKNVSSISNKRDVRIKVPMNVLASEMQWWFETPKQYGSYKLRAVSYEGENLGVKPDLA